MVTLFTPYFKVQHNEMHNLKKYNILSVRDRASLIDVLNENQRMQQW
jgi:hypothetical protein